MLKEIKKSSFEVFLAFIVLTIISPWFYIALANKGYFFDLNKPKLTFSQVADEVNMFQGEVLRSGVPFGRLVVNKYSMIFRQLGVRYLESYDPKFLFFVGGLDYKDSIRQSGVILLGYLPLILYGFYMSFKSSVWTNRRRQVVYGLLLLSPLPSVFLSRHYDVLYKIGFILVLTYLASLGFVLLFRKNRIVWLAISVFILIELLNFYHNFYNHFPKEFERQVFSYWR